MPAAARFAQGTNDVAQSGEAFVDALRFFQSFPGRGCFGDAFTSGQINHVQATDALFGAGRGGGRGVPFLLSFLSFLVVVGFVAGLRHDGHRHHQMGPGGMCVEIVSTDTSCFGPNQHDVLHVAGGTHGHPGQPLRVDGAVLLLP